MKDLFSIPINYEDLILKCLNTLLSTYEEKFLSATKNSMSYHFGTSREFIKLLADHSILSADYDSTLDELIAEKEVLLITRNLNRSLHNSELFDIKEFCLLANLYSSLEWFCMKMSQKQEIKPLLLVDNSEERITIQADEGKNLIAVFFNGKFRTSKFSASFTE